MSAPIALLTDFGLYDAYVGVLKGVILSRNPAATLVDLSHAVPPQDIRRGAFLLATAVDYFPDGTVFLAVVDPGVGTTRRALALSVAEKRFVGPDNGLLAWTLRHLARQEKLALDARDGQLRHDCRAEIVELTQESLWLRKPSSTFHGRDIFAPVAAELSLGRPVAELGSAVDWLRDLPWPEPRRTGDTVLGQVLTTDGFGNLITNLAADDLPPAPRFEIADRRISGLSPHFQAGEGLLAVLGSSALVELIVPNGSAADELNVGDGTPVRVSSG